VAGHSGQFTPGGYLSTVKNTTLAGIEPITSHWTPRSSNCCGSEFVDRRSSSSRWSAAARFPANLRREQTAAQPLDDIGHVTQTTWFAAAAARSRSDYVGFARQLSSCELLESARDGATDAKNERRGASPSPIPAGHQLSRPDVQMDDSFSTANNKNTRPARLLVGPDLTVYMFTVFLAPLEQQCSWSIGSAAARTRL